MKIAINIIPESQKMNPEFPKKHWPQSTTSYETCYVTFVDDMPYMVEKNGETLYSQRAISDQKHKQWYEFWR